MLRPSLPSLPKSPTGIAGFDEITHGGLPTGRPTLVCGSAGSGKTLFAMEFLVQGILQFGENGVMMSFEESADALAQNVASLGYDVPKLIHENRLVIDPIRIHPAEILETGEYDLEGLFIRLELAVQSVNAKRVVLDTLEALFAGLKDSPLLRSEIVRLFDWLRERGLTAVITAEQGNGAITRYGLEEYVSDCVILLDHRVRDQISTRRMRILKYRGTAHGTNEYPFLLDKQGIIVMPITSLNIDYDVSDQRISTGVAGLDQMFGGQGIFRGSSLLISGAAGAGKSNLAAQLAAAACERGDRCLYISCEETSKQFVRNCASIGLDLKTPVERGVLRIFPARPHVHGLEQHLVEMYRAIDQFEPAMVIIDPVTSLISAGTLTDAGLAVVRLVDFLKGRGITLVMTDLIRGVESLDRHELGLSSMVDSWLMLLHVVQDARRLRTAQIIKSRGTNHSKIVHELFITDDGIEFVDLYSGDKRLRVSPNDHHQKVHQAN